MYRGEPPDWSESKSFLSALTPSIQLPASQNPLLCPLLLLCSPGFSVLIFRSIHLFHHLCDDSPAIEPKSASAVDARGQVLDGPAARSRSIAALSAVASAAAGGGGAAVPGVRGDGGGGGFRRGGGGFAFPFQPLSLPPFLSPSLSLSSLCCSSLSTSSFSTSISPYPPPHPVSLSPSRSPLPPSLSSSHSPSSPPNPFSSIATWPLPSPSSALSYTRSRPARAARRRP
jgi:hypothetical protein